MSWNLEKENNKWSRLVPLLRLRIKLKTLKEKNDKLSWFVPLLSPWITAAAGKLVHTSPKDEAFIIGRSLSLFISSFTFSFQPLQNWQQNLSCATCWPPLQPMLMAPSAQLSVYPALFLTSWCLFIRLSINPAKKWQLILIQLFISADCRHVEMSHLSSFTSLFWNKFNHTALEVG